MLSIEENALLRQISPGTPMGELFRRFWLPAALSEELPTPDCPPIRLRMLSEDLVAFRDTSDNDYNIDREMQRNEIFTGIAGTRNQDRAMTESMGSISDRPGEHLGTLDAATIAARRRLLIDGPGPPRGHRTRGSVRW